VLREANGYAFGGIASGLRSGGVDPVPAEFMTMMAAAAGPAIEKAWRLSKIDALADVSKTWLCELCDELVDTVEFAEGLLTVGGDDTHEVPLSWSSGATIGVLCLKLAAGKSLNSHHKAMIGVTKKVLKVCIEEVEAMHIGQPSDMEGLDSAGQARMMLPKKLLAYARKLLGDMDLKEAIGELKSYKSPPEVVFLVMKSVMVVLEKKKLKELKEWQDVRALIGNKLVEDATALDATAKSKKEKWVDGKKSIKGLDSEAVVTKGSVPVQSFFKWLEIIFLCRKVSKELRKKDKEEDEEEEEEEEEEE